MVSWSGHIVPFIVTVAIWFVATGLIAWALGTRIVIGCAERSMPDR